MSNQIDISRSSSVYTPNIDHPHINLIGVGATGSHIWDNLVCLGYQNMTCYDFDDVEEHNLNNQTYLEGHIGIAKVAALDRLTKMKHGSADYSYIAEKVTPEMIKEMEGIVILAIDTMSGRKELGDAIKSNSKIKFFVESRIASRHCHVYNFPNAAYVDWANWFNTLIDDNDPRIEVSACGGSISVKPTITLAASLVTWGILDWINEKEYVMGINTFLSPPTLGNYQSEQERYDADNDLVELFDETWRQANPLEFLLTAEDNQPPLIRLRGINNNE
jgi:molybdopterin/thiamine biosynthesis adenylyltransferase